MRISDIETFPLFVLSYLKAHFSQNYLLYIYIMFSKMIT